MKIILKYILLVCCICFSTLAYSQMKWVSLDSCSSGTDPTVTLLKSDSLTYQVRIHIHGFYDEQIVKDSVVYHKLSFGNGFTTSRIGLPALPIISQLIAIPSGNNCTGSILKKNWVSVSMGRIYPYQKPLLETETEKEFIANDSVYNSNEFKSSLLEEGNINTWRGINNVAFSICPFEYYPKDKELSVLTDFTFTVNFAPSIDSPAINKSIDRKDLDFFDNKFNLSTVDNQVDEGDNYDYLIIVGDNSTMLNSQALKEFCKWKAYKGFKTKIVSTATTGSTCQSIKNYISSEYKKGIKYVLFVGDDDRIPLYCWNGSQNSDYWYGCMDGDNDDQADIAIGRFSTNSLPELQNMIDKTIKYESTDNNYAQYVQLVAHKQSAPEVYQACCEAIRTEKYNNPLIFFKAYGASTENGGTNATNSDVISRINQGVNIVNYRGHGAWDEWAWNWSADNKGFYADEVNQLTNTFYPVIFGIACSTADIKDHTCLMESFTRSAHGAVAYLGATENSYTEANHSLDKILFKELLNDDIVNMGELNVKSQIRNIAEVGNFTAVDNAFCYLCGNDPSLEIWTQNPKSFANIEASKASDGLHISVGGVTGFYVSVTSKDGDFLYKKSTTTNSVVLPDYNSDYHVVLNKQNFIPMEVQSQETSYLQNRTITDNEEITGNRIEVGYDVTNSSPYGNVTVKNGGSLKLKSTSGTFIKNGFKCEKGATLVIE